MRSMTMRWMAMEVAIHHSRRDAVPWSRAMVYFNSSMISFSNFRGGIWCMMCVGR